MSEKIGVDHVRRRAVVYVRQSTPGQVLGNLESQRRQYALADRAKQLGFVDVEVIDDDLGKSGSGLASRPGFERLVAMVCGTTVGAVFCIEASRLARNGRDWHHLIDFCALVGTLIIDPDGVYDPRLANDRLLLGLKGTMSEFELTLFRQRSYEALRAKAKRGELRFCLPIGFRWTDDGRIEIDADRRVQDAIRGVFRRFDAHGSVRQVLLAMTAEQLSLPSMAHGDRTGTPVWRRPVYNTVHSILTNPTYAGGYAFGRTEARTKVVGDRGRKTHGHKKPMSAWTVLIHDHHSGYITWEQFERNQRIVADNAHMKQRMAPKAGRGGRALLAGLLRCRRCGRMLHVTYAGLHGRVVRYDCRGAHVSHGAMRCISFGGLRPDEALARALLDALTPRAIDAAIAAASHVAGERGEAQRALELELEQARYESRLAARRYEAVDPDNRLVASELEVRWNAALAHAEDIEKRLGEMALPMAQPQPVDREALLALADSLPAVWNSPAADMRLKQRIVRMLVHEIVADIDPDRREIVLLVHWHGGRHTEIRAAMNRTGRHGRSTNEDALSVVRRMAGRWSDEQIAATLNRLGMRTGTGLTWNGARVHSLRYKLKLPDVESGTEARNGLLTLSEVQARLGISNTVVRRLIREGTLPATQVVPCAPYEIASDALNIAAVKAAVRNARRVGADVRTRAVDRQTLPLPGIAAK